MRKLLTILFLAIAFCTLSCPAWAIAPDGQQIFNANCSACHIGGNNVIIANKTLRKEALEKYGMNSLEAIKTQVLNGKNAMPSFKERLQDSEITAVAEYVLSQSEKGW
ncbi:MAG: c-type cytochrome [Leptolyngbyaceae cyanobacterium CSU_1_3]|nr:c-type cytochrome [Leptolyngbyaceae cyanobacterium CSU_1_3]